MINMLFANEATVLRNGKEVTFPVNENGVAEVIKSNEAKLISKISCCYRFYCTKYGSTEKPDLLKGDRIISVNGKPASSQMKFRER